MRSKRFFCFMVLFFYALSTGTFLDPFIRQINVGGIAEADVKVAINTNFPDAIFRSYIEDNFDKDGDGILDTKEISNATVINVKNKAITSLKGIEYLTALVSLDCSSNKELTALDLSNNLELLYLDCRNSNLKDLHIQNCSKLEYLNCGDHDKYYGNLEITNIDLSNFPALKYLDCSRMSHLSELNLSKNTALETLICYETTALKKLDLSNNTRLKTLNCAAFFGKHSISSTKTGTLSELDLSKNVALEELICSYNDFTAIDITNNVALKKLDCSYNKISELDLSKNIALEELICSYNDFTAIDITNNVALKKLDCNSNKISELDLSKNLGLEELRCESNNLSELNIDDHKNLEVLHCGTDELKGIDLTKNKTALKSLQLYGQIDLSNCPELTYLNCGGKGLKTLDLSNNKHLFDFYLSESSLTYLDMSNLKELFMFRDYGNDNLVAIDAHGSFYPYMIGSYIEVSASSIDLEGSGVTEVYVEGIRELNLKDANNLEALGVSDCSLTHLEIPHKLSFISHNWSGQIRSNMVFESTDNENYPYKFDLRNCMPESSIEAVVKDSLKAYDSKGQEIETLYSNGIVQFKSHPAELKFDTGVYVFNTGTYADRLMDVTLLFYGKPAEITTSELPIGNVCEAYYAKITADTDLIENWSISTKLPFGLSFDYDTGVISGTPLESCDISVDIEVKNKAGTCKKTFSLVINMDTSSSKILFPNYIHDGVKGENYSAVFRFNPSSLKILQIDFGVLPPGLELRMKNIDNISDKILTISGIPEKSGTFTFWVSILDTNWREIYEEYTINIGVKIDSTEFPDEKFRSYISNNFDKDGNDCLSYEEISAIKTIDVSNKNIADLKGIEFFTALEELICDGNKLSVLDVSKNTALKTLHCSKNSLTSLNLSNNELLENVECDNNKLTALDVSNNLKLDYLSCSGNSIVKLDVSNNSSLKWLYCNGNQLTELILGNNSVLQEINCENNSSLTRLDIQGCPKLLANNNILADTTLTLITGEDLPEFGNSTLVLDGKIGINFYVYIPEAYNPEECYMVFESRRGISNENPNEKYNPEFYSMRNGKKYYAYTCYINSAQMAEEVTATFYFNGKTITKKDSVDAYLNRAKEHESELSDNVNNLMKAIRNYGHYVQPMLSISGNWTIGDKYAEMPAASEITTADIEEAKTNLAQYAKVEYQNSIGIEKNNFSLNLDTETIINVYSIPASTYKGTVSVTVDGQAYETVEDYSSGSLRYKTEIKNIKAPDLNKTYSVFVEANGINMIQVSALSYAQAVLNANLSTIGNVPIDIMKQAVTALYKYHVTAKAYMDGGKQ